MKRWERAEIAKKAYDGYGEEVRAFLTDAVKEHHRLFVRFTILVVATFVVFIASIAVVGSYFPYPSSAENLWGNVVTGIYMLAVIVGVGLLMLNWSKHTRKWILMVRMKELDYIPLVDFFIPGVVGE